MQIWQGNLLKLSAVATILSPFAILKKVDSNKASAFQAVTDAGRRQESW